MAEHRRLSSTLSLIVILLAIVVAFIWFNNSVAYSSRNAPGTIAYSAGSEIRLIEADGSNDRRIWHEPLDEAYRGVLGLDWRPDGQMLAFSSEHQVACSFYESDLYTILPNGSNLRRVTNGPTCEGLAAFPKGSVTLRILNQLSNHNFYFLYIEGAPSVVQVTVPPGNEVEVTVNNVADLGNVPQKIALIQPPHRWIDPSLTVNVVAGSNVTAGHTFVIGSANSIRDYGVSGATWRSDGSQFGFVIASHILERIAVNAPNSSLGVPITAANSGANGDHLAWSPTGDRFIYSNLEGIFLVNMGSAGPGMRLVEGDGIQQFFGIDWLPNGSGFVFAQTAGQFSQERANLYEYRLSSGQIIPLTNFQNAFVGQPSVSPDGQYIAFERAPNLVDAPTLWVMRRDRSDMWSLGVQGNQPDWRPDPTVFATDRTYLPGIFQNYDGGFTPPQPTATPGPPQPTNTPVPTSTLQPTATPTATATRPALPTVPNGNFEQGANGAWEEASTNFGGQGSLITQPGNAISFNPRSGSWLAWLGGSDDEISNLSQDFTIPEGTPIHLVYYYQIRSEETDGCDFDVAAVLVDGVVQDGFGLCEDNNTNGWKKGSINMSSYAGENVTVTFAAETDTSVLSSFFIDDVSFQSSP